MWVGGCECGCVGVSVGVPVFFDSCVHVVCRFGIGRFTTEEEIRYTVDKCVKVVQRLREMRYV